MCVTPCMRLCLSDFHVRGTRTASHQYSEWVRPASIRHLVPTLASHLHDVTMHVCVHAQDCARAGLCTRNVSVCVQEVSCETNCSLMKTIIKPGSTNHNCNLCWKCNSNKRHLGEFMFCICFLQSKTKESLYLSFYGRRKKKKKKNKTKKEKKQRHGCEPADDCI